MKNNKGAPSSGRQPQRFHLVKPRHLIHLSEKEGAARLLKRQQDGDGDLTPVESSSRRPRRTRTSASPTATADDDADATTTSRRRKRPSSSTAAGDSSTPDAASSQDSAGTPSTTSSRNRITSSSTPSSSSLLFSLPTSPSSSAMQSTSSQSASVSSIGPAEEAASSHTLAAQHTAVIGIASAVGGVAVVIFCIVCFVLWRKRKNRNDPFGSSSASAKNYSNDSLTGGAMTQTTSAPDLAYANRPESFINNVQAKLFPVTNQRALSPIQETSRGNTPEYALNDNRPDPFRTGFGAGASAISSGLGHGRSQAAPLNQPYSLYDARSSNPSIYASPQQYANIRRMSAMRDLDAVLPRFPPVGHNQFAEGPSEILSNSNYTHPYNNNNSTYHNHRMSQQSHRLSATTGLSRDLRY